MVDPIFFYKTRAYLGGGGIGGHGVSADVSMDLLWCLVVGTRRHHTCQSGSWGTSNDSGKVHG